MKYHSRLRFALGAVRHPGEFWRRIREISRIVMAPPAGNEITAVAEVAVDLIPIGDDEFLRANVVRIYSENPSPFVHGSKTLEALRTSMEKGLRFFLIANREGELVGVRAFNPAKNRLQSTVTEYRHRGKGYQLAAGKKLMDLLYSEGHTEFHSIVLRSNTRIQRTMAVAGWKMEPDPKNPELLKCVIKRKA